jgi:hypothetical protein
MKERKKERDVLQQRQADGHWQEHTEEQQQLQMKNVLQTVVVVVGVVGA